MMSDRQWRLRAAARDLGLALLWVWHETFGHHDMRCVERDFRPGYERVVLECDCRARVETTKEGGVEWSRR